MVFVTLFTLTLKSQADEDAFLAAFRPLQAHCAANEPGTLTYEVHQATQRDGAPVPHKFCVVERYARASDFEDVHLKSPAFAAFKTLIGSIGVAEQALESYSNDAVQPALDAMPLSDADVLAITKTDAIPKGFLVFGGARHGAKIAYTEEAVDLGKYIAAVQAAAPTPEKRRPLVYGGGTVGIMGEVAQAVKAAGGLVVSVIPNALRPREASGETIGDVNYFTSTMAERKSIMFAHSDTVVAMPGGAGTFDELLEVITLFQLNAYRPRIGLVNVCGFFDPFVALLDHLIAEGFLEKAVKDFVVMDATARGLMAKLETFELPPSPAHNIVWNGRP